jgi:asparagine synthase (glutamine-hydrolysing)
MCGISGYFAIDRDIETDEIIRRMTRAVAHRGPDDEGIVLLAPDDRVARNLGTEHTARGVGGLVGAGTQSWPHRVAFGHRRFSIVDLSPSGHQPFWSSDGHVCVCFNGEIYNYVELRDELERLGHEFRTSSDTEVLAESFLEWGTDAFERFVGFWALALYDARRGKVLLARDRLGKASLYVGEAKGVLWWSSEIKGVLAGAGDSLRAIRDQGVSDFVIRSWRDVYERTFFQRIETFPRASWAWIEADGTFAPSRFWSVPTERMSEHDISVEEAGQGIRDRLAEALRVRFRADVPVGFELSGGLDSSSLLAIGASRGHKVRAFTIAFPGTSADEEPYARMVRDRYRSNTEYNIVEQQVGDFFDAADRIVGSMDEPFHSPNILSIQRIWEDMSARGIRVTIKGDAGDELFAGYPGVYHSEYLWDLLEHGRLRLLNREITSFSEDPSQMFSPAYLRRMGSAMSAGMRLHGGSLRHSAARIRSMRRAHAAGFRCEVAPQRQKTGSIEEILIDRVGDWQMNYWLRVGNLASMAVPIEIRAPFLDHRVVEFVFRLPVSYLIRDGWLKWILRDAMKDMLPGEVIWRTNKMGFPFPYREWLKASKERFFATMSHTEVPYVELTSLRANYDRLAAEDPLLLWRLIVLCLWWKKCVVGRPLGI